MTLQAMRRLGAVAIIVTGAVHLQQYLGDYHAIPTIGPLFLLNAIGSAVIAAGLLMSLERRLGERRGDVAHGLLALGGVAIAVGSLVALWIAETSTLFGFSEGPLGTPMLIAIAAEIAAAVLLAAVAVSKLTRSPSQPKGARPPRPLRSS